MEAPITIDKVWSEIKQNKGRIRIVLHISRGCVTVNSTSQNHIEN